MSVLFVVVWFVVFVITDLFVTTVGNVNTKMNFGNKPYFV